MKRRRIRMSASAPAALGTILGIATAPYAVVAHQNYAMAGWALLAAFWAYQTYLAERRLERDAPRTFLGTVVLLLDGDTMTHTEPTGIKHSITATIDYSGMPTREHQE